MQNNEKHRQNDGPIHSPFLRVLAFHESGKEAPPYTFLKFWRRLVDFGCNCNVVATADTFRRWPFRATTFSKVLAESVRIGAEEPLINLAKQSIWNRKGYQKEPQTSAKGRPKYIKKVRPKKGERNKRERGRGWGRTWNCGALLAPFGRFWISISAPIGSRRVHPFSVSLCIWRYRKK